MNEKEKYKSKTAKVYVLNEENQDAIKNAEYVYNDKTGNFTLTLTKEDLEFVNMQHESGHQKRRFEEGSYEDLIYDFLLYETGIDEFLVFNNRRIFEIDPKTEIVSIFYTENNVLQYAYLM